VAVGIDLGTTFSCVAFVRDGHPIVIPDKGRAEKTIPSMVGFDEDGVNVGHLAQLTFESDPASTVFGKIEDLVSTTYSIPPCKPKSMLC